VEFLLGLATWTKRAGMVAAILVIILPVLFLMSRGYLVNTRVDQDGGPVPEWLPSEVSDLHLRGTAAATWFSGRCTQAAVEAWAARRGIPLQKREHGAIQVVDYGKVPRDWTLPGELWTEAARTELENAEVLVWEKRQTNGGGITLSYLPDRQVIFGSMSLW
jgi:hypothetical protein